MKKILILLLSVIFVFGLVGCNRSMNFIIENEPRISGIVTEVYDNSIIIHGESMEGYPSAWDCSVSLDVENEDSYTNISVGDEVVVYYNGDIAESDPLQINTVYAITLKTPASRMENNDSEKWDLIPMVMVDGILYLDTGHESTALRCGTMDGEITSKVDGNEKPTVNDQSNFGTGYGYQYGAIKGTIEIYMNDKWWIFATEEVRQEIQFLSEENNLIYGNTSVYENLGLSKDDIVISNPKLFTIPPELVVLCDGKQITAIRGTYSWEYKNEDGTYTRVEADSMHPLESKEHMTDLPLTYSYTSAIDVFKSYLQFNIAPDEVEIRYWSADCWNDSTAESEELAVQAVEVDFENGGYTTNYTAKLLEGNYIYEVIAKWSSSEEYSGTAHYSFYTIMGDYEIMPIQG